MANIQKITPFLWFDGSAEEAVNLYVSLFKGSKVLTTARYGEAGPGPKGSVMTVEFLLAGQHFMALNGGPGRPFTEAISLMVSAENQDEVDMLWSKLTANGGEESMCGWLKDRFGLSWQIIPERFSEIMREGDPTKTPRVFQAMMTMRKFDIAQIEKAYAGR